MSIPITEWEFTADVESWINEILAKDPSLPFSAAKCEQRVAGSQKRRDLTLLDRDGHIVLTGEVKLPYRPDGGSPYNEAFKEDARRKAHRAGARFFFTWNINQFVLWETRPAKTSWTNQPYKSWDVTSVHHEEHMRQPMAIHAIKTWLPGFLKEYAQIHSGAIVIGTKSPDEIFIQMIESALQMPILFTMQELPVRYAELPFRTLLDKWMRDDLGWTIHTDDEGIRENLERASKFACYSLLNKLVFCEALYKHYGRRMQKLVIPEHIDTAERLRGHLAGYFARTRIATGDYETVFPDYYHDSIASAVPFFSENAASHWRNLITQIHLYDFSKLDYEVIGSIFERLIGPEERHKYGQFYTRVEVVDLINSFCIREGDERIMDPACGGGTFLVRAYARKKELAGDRPHSQILSELFGVDVSLFAAHLTTINLATRELMSEGNYPRIARSDFFDVEPRKSFISLPKRVKAKGLGEDGERDIEIPALDAVVGNPPYIRQEEIRASKKNGNGPEHGTKDYYQQLVKGESGAGLSGRSDLHCYFWPHAASFLKENGYLCFLTSSQWLDVEYGFGLQAWILRNFEVIAVIESIDEPWFVGARVATAITILRRQPDEKARMRNTVRFVQLRRPIREILCQNGTPTVSAKAADGFRDEILSLKHNAANARFRARLLCQGELWDDGVRLGKLMAKANEPGNGNGKGTTGDYYGGKWGVHLRAPDLWFRLMDRLSNSLTPLGDIAEVKFGVKTGNDSFFFPIDCSKECLSEYPKRAEFEEAFGVPRKDVASGKVKLVRCGEGRGEVRPVEACYLEPEIHSLMEVDTLSVSPHDCSRLILLIEKRKSRRRGKYVLEYVKWAESRNLNVSPTCAGRETAQRMWYDLTDYPRPDIVLPKIQQYRLFAFLNPDKLYQNSSLLGIYGVPNEMVKSICAALNSTIGILSRLVHARMLGNEGNIQLDVYSAKMMLVPDFTRCDQRQVLKRMEDAFDRMLNRKVLAFLSERRLRAMAYRHAGKEDELGGLSDQCELDMPDRRELDDAVLEMMGVASREERGTLIDELYAYLREFFETTRQKEEKAIVNKKKAKRRGPAKPGEIAAQIYERMNENDPQLLRQYDPDFIDGSKPYDTYELPADGEPTKDGGLFNSHGVAFVKAKKTIAIIDTRNATQDYLVIAVARSGVRGFVRIPHDEDECRRVQGEYETFVAHRGKRLLGYIQERTADEDLQEKIYLALMPMLLRPREKHANGS